MNLDNRCAAGVEVPRWGACPECGALWGNPCGKRRKEQEAARVKRIADKYIPSRDGDT